MTHELATELDLSAIPAVLAALADADHRLADLLDSADEKWLREPSALAGWSRLTVLCHIRYVGEAMRRVTTAFVDGRTERVYPNGRDVDRPTTLAPAHGETGRAVARAVQECGARLLAQWSTLSPSQWTAPISDPDYGTQHFSRWLALRLTEVEVHTADLVADRTGPACHAWSRSFVEALLPLRVAWLDRARTRADADLTIAGTWHLAAPSRGWSVTGAFGDRAVDTRRGHVGDRGTMLAGDEATLLALLLGRDPSHVHATLGEPAAAFKRAFPGP